MAVARLKFLGQGGWPSSVGNPRGGVGNGGWRWRVGEDEILIPVGACAEGVLAEIARVGDSVVPISVGGPIPRFPRRGPSETTLQVPRGASEEPE